MQPTGNQLFVQVKTHPNMTIEIVIKYMHLQVAKTSTTELTDTFFLKKYPLTWSLPNTHFYMSAHRRVSTFQAHVMEGGLIREVEFVYHW